MPLDKADDLHLTAALGADQRIGLIHLLDQRRPALARGLAIGPENRFSILIRRGALHLSFGSQAPFFIGIPTVISNQMLARIGNACLAIARRATAGAE